MKDLKLNEDRETLKRILEQAIPQTLQDVVLIYASVMGTREGALFEENYVKKIYPQCIKGKLWSAIQVTTASSLCAVVDLVLAAPDTVQGIRDPGIVSLTRCAHESVWSLLPMMSICGDSEGIGLERRQRRWQHREPLVGLSAARTSLLESVNPATGETIAQIRACSADDYEHIVRESIAAFQQWRLVPAPKRGELVRLIGARVAGKQGSAWHARVARGRQDQSRGGRRSAGNDRHGRLRRRPVAHAVWHDDAF